MQPKECHGWFYIACSNVEFSPQPTVLPIDVHSFTFEVPQVICKPIGYFLVLEGLNGCVRNPKSFSYVISWHVCMHCPLAFPLQHGDNRHLGHAEQQRHTVRKCSINQWQAPITRGKLDWHSIPLTKTSFGLCPPCRAWRLEPGHIGTRPWFWSNKAAGPWPKI